MLAATYDDFGGPITIGEVPVPELGPDDVLIRVEATGICRSDWHGWQGHDPDITRLPHVPGHEFAGSVSAVGSSVATWSPGDAVVVPFIAGCGRCRACIGGTSQVCSAQTQPGFTHWGSFAEFVLVHNADFNLIARPPAIDAVTGAALGCRFTTAYRATVHQGRLGEGESIAVHGCGGVGLSVVMIASSLGAEVIAIDPDREARAFAARLGADAIAPAEAVERLAALDRGGPDVSIDAVGHPEVVGRSISTLAPRGRHVQVGLLPADGLSNVDAGLVVARELELIGSHGMPAAGFAPLLDLVTSGRLDPKRLIGAQVDLGRGVEMLMNMDERSPGGIAVITSV